LQDRCAKDFFSYFKQRQQQNRIYWLYNDQHKRIKGKEQVVDYRASFYQNLIGIQTITRNAVDMDVFAWADVLNGEQQFSFI